MATPPLGRLQRVDLRRVWLSESSDFTPWLAQADNLALLGETLGLELDLESTEEYVGPFRADIVCKVTTDSSWVLIENQLERTDHSHLGQLLTYAAGLDAVTIVWIAQRFTDEHRAALDWLNEVTAEHINFFGIEIELLQIDDSRFAPSFKVVSQPNDWTKQVTAGRQQPGALSASDQLRLDFWTSFKRYLEDHNSFLRTEKPSPQNWMTFAVGRSNFWLTALVGMHDGHVGANLTLTGPDAKAHYHLLAREREAIEAEIVETLVWRELPNNKSSIIELYDRDATPSDESNWPTYHAWIQQKVEAFHRAFAPRIKTLKASDYVPTNPADASSEV